MSRIILSRYDNGEDHVVIGFDRPLQTFYWQEFAQEPEDWDALSEEEAEEWDEMLGYAGYVPRELPTVTDLYTHAATHSKMVSDTILEVSDRLDKRGLSLVHTLSKHQHLDYPESNVVLDLSEKE